MLLFIHSFERVNTLVGWKEVWGPRGGERGLGLSRRRKGSGALEEEIGQTFFSILLSLSHIIFFFPLSPEVMLLKRYVQYASKFENLSSGHRTGKSKFSFQSQTRAMPKNAQTIAQLHSSHTLAKKCSKFSKSGFNSTWTLNFQMFKLDLEKAREPEIKLPMSVGS